MLFDLFVDFAVNKRKKLIDKGVQVKLLGKINLFPKFVVKAMEKLLSDTKEGTGLILNLCFGYGGRAEIVDACRKILDTGVRAEKLSEELFEKNLYTVGMPDVDVMVRTGGAKRVSNFLPWQLSYAEMFFVDKYWPEFTKRELRKVLKEFEERERRFGK